MKIIRNIIIAAAAFVLTAAAADAQVGKRWYIDAGWQFNATVQNNFSESAQGLGAYLESGYYLLPRIAVGAFVSYNTNNQYFARETYYFDDGALNTDKFHSLYQVPFGATLRYRFLWKKVQPYAEAKIGANFAREYQLYSVYGVQDSQWGFYVSPEIGITIHPFRKSNLGLQLAGYYSYATNRSSYFGINGLNNAGFKLGISF